MSNWTYISGIITVCPLGRTQAEKRYILETVLNHLPVVSGSESDMEVQILQSMGWSCSSSHDEFGERTNNLRTRYGTRSRNRGWLETQDKYFLVVEGNLRDRMYKDTFKEFQKWLCRLAKRVMIDDVLVKLNDYDKEFLFTNEGDVYGKMFELPSWSNETGEPTWCEYMMFEPIEKGSYPRILKYKYFQDKENDDIVEKWLGLSD